MACDTLEVEIPEPAESLQIPENHEKTLDLLVAAVLLLCVAVLAGCGDRIDRKDFIAAFSLDRDYER